METVAQLSTRAGDDEYPDSSRFAETGYERVWHNLTDGDDDKDYGLHCDYDRLDVINKDKVSYLVTSMPSDTVENF